jgi:hypothetical protein
MHGEYDFSNEKLTDSLGLTDPELIDLTHLAIGKGNQGLKTKPICISRKSYDTSRSLVGF